MLRLAKYFAVALLVASVGCGDREVITVAEPCLDFDFGCDGVGLPPVDFILGSIQVTTSTTGPGRDTDGYTVAVDGTASQSISVNGTVTFSNLPPGSHTVELSAVGSNCPVSSANPQTISVTADDTTQVIFNVVCGHLAYVASAVGTVSVIETATNTVVATISVGGNTRGLAITPDGASAYVTNRDLNIVSVIETTSNTVVATVDVGSGSGGVAITPDGALAYVATGGTVSVIATATNTVVATISDLDGPGDLAVTPDGAFVYVTSAASDPVSVDDNEVRVIETASNTVVDTFSVKGAGAVAITPNGAFVYVTNTSGFSTPVFVIETANNTVVDSIIVSSPNGLAITPDGTLAYVTANGPGDGTSLVHVIETASNTVVGTVSGILGGFSDVAITPDGAFAYVTNVLFDRVHVIETASNTEIVAVGVRAGPFAVAITPF